MFSLPTRLLFSLAGLAVVAAVVYDIAISERTGVLLLAALALAALSSGLA